jgi:hypothetical protein
MGVKLAVFVVSRNSEIGLIVDDLVGSIALVGWTLLLDEYDEPMDFEDMESRDEPLDVVIVRFFAWRVRASTEG